MENAQSLIQLYNAGFYISLGVTVLSFFSAVFMFFRFNIRNILAIRTGHAEKISVKKMQNENEKTGTLRQRVDLDYTTAGLRNGTAQTTLLSATDSQTQPLAAASVTKEQTSGTVQPLAPAVPADFHFTITEQQVTVHTNEWI